MSRLKDSPAGRVDMATRAAGRVVGDGFGGSAGDAVLTMSRPRRTAEMEAIEAAEQLDAARTVARLTMLRPHGCIGKRCRDEAHAADREARDRVLSVLGIEVPS